MIAVTCDAGIVNGFANHPDILPAINPGGELDLAEGIGEPNVAMFGAHGGFVWAWSAPATYEGHVVLTKAGRGQWGVTAGRMAVAMMADRGAQRLWCRIHPDLPHIGVFASALGFADTGLIHKLDAGQGLVGWRIFNWSK